MGVHISFVRSTNLDSWQLAQLRTMKVGGNQSARDFFTKNGGSALLNDSDTKKKYSTRVADMYKEELARRVKEDASRYPAKIYVEGAEVVTPAPTANDDDDFFSSWDKPKPSSKPSTPAPSTTSTSPPVLGRSTSATSSTASVTSAPRTVSSASLRSASTPVASRPGSKLGASRLTSSSSVTGTSSTGTTAAKKSKLGGLGAKKAAAPIDFDEAQRKAEEEAEKAKKLEEERKRVEEEEQAKQEAEKAQVAATAKAKAAEAAANGKKVLSSPSSNAAAQKENNPELERLGMGMRRLGFGAVPSGASAATKSKSCNEDEAPTTARDRFGSQKAISSDMYFGRNDYDPNAVSEAQTRLQEFRGATSISSNQYFGRDEEEDLHAGSSGEGLLGDGSLAGLENATRDAIQKVMSNPDVQNAADSIRAGALKLSEYLAQMSER